MKLITAIKKTIDYAASFGSHINKKEIEQRLISNKIFTKSEINNEIKKIKWKNKKNKWNKLKMAKAKQFALLIEDRFKEVFFLGISGSVASGHPKENDDIDLLIVTKADTLWKNRLKLRWWVYKNKIPHRKFETEEIKDQFCFNLWLDEKFLEIPKDMHNLKNATDLILLIPLLNKNKTYEKILVKNSWVKKYLATGYMNKLSDCQIVRLSDKTKNRSEILKKISNWIYFWPQYVYMKNKIRQEKIGLHQAFFHRQMIK